MVRVRRAARQAGLENTGPHILRHSFRSHLAMCGAPARAIQELAGHRDVTTPQAVPGAPNLIEWQQQRADKIWEFRLTPEMRAELAKHKPCAIPSVD